MTVVHSMTRLAMAVALALSCAACAAATAPPTAAEPASHGDESVSKLVQAAFQTEATASGEAGAAVVVLNADKPADSRIVATAALGGLEVYDLSGKRLSAAPAGEVAAVAVAYDVTLGATKATLLAAIDTTSNSLRLFSLSDDQLTEVGTRAISLGFAGEGVCLFRNSLDSALYAFVVGDGGEVDQQIIYASADGRLDARQVRRISVPSPLKQCATDSLGYVYASEETVGIWRFNADPEAETGAVLVDSPLLGHLSEEVGGITLYDGGEGSHWLLASDASAGRINVYDRDRDAAYIGSFALAAVGDDEAIEEPGSLSVSAANLGDGLANGVLLVADEDASNYKAVSISAIAASLGLAPGNGAHTATQGRGKVVAISALAETVPVGSFGDAADDPAIWANPDDASRSLVVATDKKAGMYVNDMQGRVVQFLPTGKMNNVDLREEFLLGGKKIVLVAASNRTDKSIAIYRLDTASGMLVDIADGVQPTELADPYGVCLYRSASSGKTYVFINGDETRKRQWELVDAGNGRVKAQFVRELSTYSQTEGCVADDASGVLYIGEEDVALWRTGAEPDADGVLLAVDRVDGNPAIKDDIEGVGIYDLGNGRGYIVASSQGNDTYAVYRLEGKQDYLGSFAVVADPVRGIDGISETDGLDVSSGNLGPGFEHGAMIAQDGRNHMPTQNQNYKYVSWTHIADALKLERRQP